MRFVDFLFALRPLVLVPAWSFFLLGLAWARRDAPGELFPTLQFVTFSLVMAGVHLVNQVVDRETDRENDKGFFLQRGIFTPQHYLLAAVVGLTAGLVGAWARDAAALGWMAAAAALGLAYSVPPLRLAARPGLDVAANAAGYGVIAVALGAGAGFAHPATMFFAGSTALAVAAVFLHTTLLDLDGDRRTGKRTSGVAWGAARTRAVAFICALASLGTALGTRWWIAVVPAFAVALLASLAALAPRTLSSKRLCVTATAAYALTAGFTCPPFLPALALLVLVTRIYYRRRFDLAYPTL